MLFWKICNVKKVKYVATLLMRIWYDIYQNETKQNPYQDKRQKDVAMVLNSR